jgi:hypothetical protein
VLLILGHIWSRKLTPVLSFTSIKRRTRKVSHLTDSNPHHSDVHDHSSGARGSSRKFSTASYLPESRGSPATGSHLKRKSGAAPQTPAPKRKKSSDVPVSAEDDPARKYCLGKLQEMFRPVFLKYHAGVDDGSGNNVELKTVDFSDEDKQRLENDANVFASELEECIFDIYGEPDKHGKQGVGPKYK